MTAPFIYELPEARIAQRPIHPYDQAKMLVIDRSRSTLDEQRFVSLPSYLKAQDLLVFNNTKVFPARLFGSFSGEGGQVEILLLEQRDEATWICLGRPLKRFKVGRGIDFAHGVRAEVLERISAHHVLLSFSVPAGASLHEQMRLSGVMPIPPYIRRGIGDLEDLQDYQTFFAANEGSVAAPTASLHFTPQLMEGIRAVGCGVEFVTLHLGTASFLPLWNEGEEAAVEPARPGREHGFFDTRLLSKIEETKARGGRVIAVGTSVVRLLETVARRESNGSGTQHFSSELFIEPGFEFRYVDAMVTNFHQ
ncbi:MAG: S-adenosylmethionine:tRNA ribosyltransferase-isomerase, partial [Deltaproteobacteria bacterium]|nr:S-adenosylmethionine:tRNA ribosyltransferase-isomerase [Deltaproteobacteria bacterium]